MNVARRALNTVVEVVRETIDDDAVDAAASVAFWLLLSLPATLLAALSALSLLGDGATEELRELSFEFVDRVFTSEADELRSAINGLFDQSKAGLFSLSIVVALVTASRGFAGLIRALDTVYDVEESRGFVRLRLASVGLALGTIAAVGAATTLWIALGDAGIAPWLRIAACGVLLVLWAATIFHVGPNHHTPWRYDVPGAVFAAAGWFVVSAGYGWYVQIAGTGNEIVGIAGALLLGVTWVWIVCLILLVGGELNEILARRAGVVSDPKRILPEIDPVAELRAALRRDRDDESTTP